MNKVQDLNLELIKLASFNEFDGVQVVKDLIEHKDLWRGAVMGRYGGYSELIPLRDIQKGCWNIDTLMITPVKGREDELEVLAGGWQADEIDWIGAERACDMLGSSSPELRADNKQILRIWWD